MSERMRRAFTTYNDRLSAAVGVTTVPESKSVQMTDAEDHPSRGIVAGTDVSFDELLDLADRQATQHLPLMMEVDPHAVLAGLFRAAFLAGVFFAQDDES